MLDTLMSRNWFGFIVSAAILIVGIGLVLAARLIPVGLLHFVWRALGAGIIVLALILIAASLRHLVMVARYRRRYPPPGRLIDVGGYRIHFAAAGQGKPTVVWIPGSHSQGLALNHLHKRTAEFARSIIFDRPSSGWSDVGPFPRTILREAKELEVLLRVAGEQPPFVLAGHSFGGALAATFADLFPEQTAGLVLLDASTADATVYGRSLQLNSKVPGLGTRAILSATFGLDWTVLKRQLQRDKAAYACLGDVLEELLANSAQPKLPVGFRSALRAHWREPLGMARGRHVLGDIPILAVIPREVPYDAERLRALLPHVSEYVARGYVRNYRAAQESVALLSRRGEVRLAPPGATHAIPYEEPDFVVELVKEMVTRARAEAKDGQQTLDGSTRPPLASA